MRWLVLLTAVGCGAPMSAEEVCAASCSGCCRDGICNIGDSAAKCGTGGALCETCGGGQTCSAARTCVSPPPPPAPCIETPTAALCQQLGCGTFNVHECDQTRSVYCGACPSGGTGGGSGGGGGTSGGSSSGGCHVDCSRFGLSCCGSSCC